MTPCATNGGMSMFEKRTGKPPPLHKCHVWGATVKAAIAKEDKRKGENRFRVGRFMGFTENGAGYDVYDPEKRTVFRSDSVRVHDTRATESVAEPEEATIGDATEKEFAWRGEHGHGARLHGEEHDERERSEQSSDDVRAQAVPLSGADDNAHDDEAIDGSSGPRQRLATTHMNIGHDEWQTLITTTGKKMGMSAVFAAQREEEEAQRERAINLLRLKIKARATGAFLRARAGGGGVLPSGTVPVTDHEADSGDDAPIWRAARSEEIEGLLKRKVLEPLRAETALLMDSVGSKFAYDIKLRSPSCEKTGPCYKTLDDGRKVRYKARFVAQGFTQKAGVNYVIDETYAPTPQLTSVRLILAQSFSQKWAMRQLDVKQAFLLADLPEGERMILRPPKGSEFDGKYLFLLLKSLYGLVQAAHHWHREIKGTLLGHGFTCVDADQGVYVRHDAHGKLQCAMALHVDDCLISAPDDILEGITTKLKAAYEMSDEPADFFLKINIRTNEPRTVMTLSQPAYAESIVKTAGMHLASRTVPTPMETPLRKGTWESFTEEEAEFMATKYEMYGTLTGMLSYLANGTRPDLAYSVGQCQQYTSFPRKAHWMALIRIVRYVAGTINYGLRFHANSQERIMMHVDSDHAGNVDDRTSTSGYVATYMGAAIAWKSKKQSGTRSGRLRENESESDPEHNQRVTSDAARSSAESELRALDLGTREALWLRKIGNALQVPECETLPIFEDNEACYYIAKGSRWSSQTKHVSTMYYAVRDDIVDQRIDLFPIDTKDNMADMFTKPLKRVMFERLRKAMGVNDISV